ncbi:MAG TPA: DUF1003 domain-containing protein [Steroidobacteraceae bacterium]|nr:DUF1003 domain-containing protein [Steroidobacteraceae bacterium]
MRASRARRRLAHKSKVAVGCRLPVRWLMETPSETRARAALGAGGQLSEAITQNISDIVELQEKELASMSAAQRRLEGLSGKVSRPGYMVALLVAVAVWISLNLLRAWLGLRPFDAPPFQWLQGVLTLIALLTATVVLIGQRRQTRLSEQRAHLDLQINLITEQKVTKLIHLIEELRQDLPMVRDRHDPHASVLQKPTDAGRVLSALQDAGLTSQPRPGDPHAEPATPREDGATGGAAAGKDRRD